MAVVFAAGPHGCSTAARQRLRHFFFEVPTTAPAEPRQPSQTVTPPLPSVAAVESFASMHEPFRARRCADCHVADAGQALMHPWPERCAECHPPLFEPRPFMHGPAAALACNECHLPHASALPHLLRQPDPALCLACHEPTMPKDADYHGDRSRACIDCHESHGGDDRRMLKPRESWHTAAPPTTRPPDDPDEGG